ncbi:hypothetical protein Tco_0155146 [Tanacetum coccineum]
MSALRRSDNENQLSTMNLIHMSILTDSKICIKMVWRYLIPAAAQDKSRFIAACSYSTDKYSILQAGNPVKEILLKLNLRDHRSILTDSKDLFKMLEVPDSSCSVKTSQDS